MTSWRLRVISGLAVAALAAVLSLATIASAQTANSLAPLPTRIEGTWVVTVTLNKGGIYANGTCTPMPNVEPSHFQSFLSFARGGTLTATTNNPTFLPGQRSPGHGVWSFLGGDKYSAVSEAYLMFDTDNPPYVLSNSEVIFLEDLNVHFRKGTQKILQTITMAGDNNWNSVAQVQFFDTVGNPLPIKGCATATAKRFNTSAGKP